MRRSLYLAKLYLRLVSTSKKAMGGRTDVDQIPVVVVVVVVFGGFFFFFFFFDLVGDVS